MSAGCDEPLGGRSGGGGKWPMGHGVLQGPRDHLANRGRAGSFYRRFGCRCSGSGLDVLFFFSSRRRHTRLQGDWSSDVCSSDLDGATIAIPNDPSNGGRALILLAKQGLIELKDPKSLTPTPLDVAKNPKKLKFKELEAPLLPRALADVDLALINTNYAIEAKLNPTKDALFIERSESPDRKSVV